MANTIYSNFFLSNTVEDQFNSHLDLQQFCTVDNSLEGVAGMKRIIHSYRATNGTEKLTVGQGNSKSIEVSYTPVEYVIALAQNRFVWNDEHAMTDPMLVPVGMKHAGTDMYNTVNADIYTEFAKTGLVVNATAPDFNAFVDAGAALNLENLEGVFKFALVLSISFEKRDENKEERLLRLPPRYRFREKGRRLSSLQRHSSKKEPFAFPKKTCLRKNNQSLSDLCENYSQLST